MAYGIPKEKVSEASGLAMGLEGLIAPQVDVSWFFSSHLSLGLYGQYGVGRYSRFCSEESCRGGVLRLGVGLQYQFAPESPWSPWLGAGVGYQRHMQKEHLAYGDTSTVESGFELMRLEAGLDFTFAGRFRVGPYVTGSMSSYFWRSMKTDGYPASSTSANSDLEFWVMPGVRFQARL
ncbi:autotransporter outer membrane beta-barrel domain-containing protein [Myxococcus sp. CA056]|uniref:autotransporter outer membrane beta-barrel domain-containing protein n=1 Tax=Myxococcus sp. CA056 TaxID=2741740 RepID=UPI00157B7695|nr:autotransporter outer membrane beta-barrel domain-containing protein [Myxococcus sp. CA056]NTX16380.1 autotransporter outer membrane beta-barrel domain-containing protein [Myxococcus sp. CA056]